MFLLTIVLIAGITVGAATPCDNSETTTNPTTTTEATCTFYGRTYRTGQRVPSMERCTECTCDPSYKEPRCRRQECPTLFCPGRVPPRYPAPDACCPVCPPTTTSTTTTTTTRAPDTCFFYGRTYRRGQRVPGGYFCTQCWCDPRKSEPVCRRQPCRTLRCRGGVRPIYPAPDTCCPVCPGRWPYPPVGPPTGPPSWPPLGPPSGPRGQ